MLVQIDKLVQLIESPVFTCEIFTHPEEAGLITLFVVRPSPPTVGTREIPASVQMLVRDIDATATEFSLCVAPQQIECCQFCRVPLYCTQTVGV